MAAPSIPLDLEPRLVQVLERARSLGFLGPGPVTAHIEHALDLAILVDGLSPARALDLGSGGGVPGLVLLAALPHLQLVLLDANQKRTRSLIEALEELGLGDRAEVVTARAEEAGRRPDLRHRFDLVVARSFGPPATTAECAAPLLQTGGHLIVSEPPGSVERWPVDGVAQLGLTLQEIVGPPRTGHRYAVLRSVAICDDRYPRRDGMPAKRPLWVSRETSR